MKADRDGRVPAPQGLGVCSLGTRLVATHRGDLWYWRHYAECTCPDYQPWGEDIAAQSTWLGRAAKTPFTDLEQAEMFRTAALEFLAGVSHVSSSYDEVKARAARERSETIETLRKYKARITERSRKEVERLRRQCEKAGRIIYTSDTVERMAKLVEQQRDKIEQLQLDRGLALLRREEAVARIEDASRLIERAGKIEQLQLDRALALSRREEAVARIEDASRLEAALKERSSSLAAHEKRLSEAISRHNEAVLEDRRRSSEAHAALRKAHAAYEKKCRTLEQWCKRNPKAVVQ